MNKAFSFLKKHLPTILSGMAAAGTIGTAVLSAVETPKAMERLEEAESEKGEALTKFEKVMAAGPAYLPAVGLGLSTIACIFGANVLNKRQQAALVSAYALLEQSYKEYREKVKMLFGEEADHVVMKAVEMEEDAGEEKIHWDEPRTFYDEYGARFFEKSERDVFLAEYELNKLYAHQGSVTVNDFYRILGLEPIVDGDRWGWSTDVSAEFFGYEWIDFEHQPLKDEIYPGNEMEYVSIFMAVPPVKDFVERVPR
jgi:hypothetical protein